MQFQYPATEVFNPIGGYRVAWSVEEYEKLLAEGWLAERPAPMVEPSPDLIKEVALKPETTKERKAREKVERERGEAVIDSPEPGAE